jgi:hypothetical protein
MLKTRVMVATPLTFLYADEMSIFEHFSLWHVAFQLINDLLTTGKIHIDTWKPLFL